MLINLSATGTNVENGTLYDSSSTVQAGQYLTITGYGYQAGASVTVKFGNLGVDTVTADANGMITDRIRVPSGDASGSTRWRRR